MTIAFLVVPHATLLDLTGPMEVFSQANHLLDKTGNPGSRYTLRTLSSTKNTRVKTEAGLDICCDTWMEDADFPIDTLMVCGISNSLEDMPDTPVYEWLQKQKNKVRRICSICTGTFFLAKAGLLDGKRATTHWALCEKLSRDYPLIHVEKDPIFITDGNISTSAGITAGMDLALALVEEDHGRNLALSTARQMVLYLKRPGSQSQFSNVLTHQHIDYRPIQELITWMQQHLDGKLTVAALAEKTRMSPRNFARVFARETGSTPAKFIDRLRLDAACRFLTESRLDLKQIANLCGLSSPDNMRRVFLKYMQVSPSEYRDHFQPSSPRDA